MLARLSQSRSRRKYSFLSGRSEARQKIILPLLPPIHLNFVWPICCSLTPVTKTKKEAKKARAKKCPKSKRGERASKLLKLKSSDQIEHEGLIYVRYSALYATLLDADASLASSTTL